MCNGIVGDIEDFEGRVACEDVEESSHAFCGEFIPFEVDFTETWVGEEDEFYIVAAVVRERVVREIENDETLVDREGIRENTHGIGFEASSDESEDFERRGFGSNGVRECGIPFEFIQQQIQAECAQVRVAEFDFRLWSDRVRLRLAIHAVHELHYVCLSEPALLMELLSIHDILLSFDHNMIEFIRLILTAFDLRDLRQELSKWRLCCRLLVVRKRWQRMQIGIQWNLLSRCG